MTRRLISSGSPYEPRVGFSRAVRVGNHIAIGGTAPIGPDGKTVAPGDPAGQTKRCIQIIQQALQDAGARLEDVVRGRILLKHIGDWEAVAKVKGEYFADIRPVDTIMQISTFIDPEWLLEIEVDAIVEENSSDGISDK
jgi:enamine deaminase RidA (YjgF/YER057c/UK114 family)